MENKQSIKFFSETIINLILYFNENLNILLTSPSLKIIFVFVKRKIYMKIIIFHFQKVYIPKF